MSNYSQLPTEPPPYIPPEEDVSESTALRRSEDDVEAGASDGRPFEQFEIDDTAVEGSSNFLQNASAQTQGMFNRAGEAGHRIAHSFSNKVVAPITSALDPVYTFYRALHVKFDKLVSRIGNPLIVKRLFYVILVATIVYIVTLSGLYPDSSGSYNGEFFKQDVLHQFIDDNLDIKRMEENLQYFSSMPHMAGTAGDLTLARYFEKVMKDAGLTVEEFSEINAYVDYGANRSLSMYEKDKVVFTSDLIEIENSDKRRRDEMVDNMDRVAFNPGSKPGKARGHLVYANYGTPEDFRHLIEHKVEVKGATVMMKYHGAQQDHIEAIPEAMKVNMANELGAAGVIFISDTSNGGDKVYDMDTIERHGLGVSRIAPGNLIAPGNELLNKEDESKTLSDLWNESEATAKIPAIPISWKDAVTLLKSIENVGLKAPKDWSLNLPVELWTGGKDTVYQVEFESEPAERPHKPIWNVYGKIQGREQEELALVIGAQRDAICEGAISPNTGSTILVELIAIFSELQRAYNWKPLRSIYFASWDGTEYNLAGSTFFAEQRLHALRREAFTYIDLSDAIAGVSKLDVAAHPMLWSSIRKSLKQVNDPATNQSLDESVEAMNTLKDSTKNYLPFVSYLGVPSVEMKFYDREGGYPKGSCKDKFDHVKEIDPEMGAHRALAAVVARLTLALVEEPMIPFDIVEFAKAMDHYLNDLKDYAGSKKTKLDTNSVMNELLGLKNAGKQYEFWLQAWGDIVNSGDGTEPTLLSVNRWAWNNKLSQIEKNMLAEPGLPGREWYKNYVFGPQLWGPDGVKKDGSSYEWGTFPSVRDALFRKDRTMAQLQLDHVQELFRILSRNLSN